MVSASRRRDGAHLDEWGGGGRLRCALKLVKLAAGPFEAEQVLRKSRQPSWRATTSSGPSSRCANKTSALSAPPSDSNRQNWPRPWREGRSCRELRWEKAGITTPRQAPPSSPMGNSPNQAPARRLCVEVPSVPQTSPRPEYTTKYFGLVDGALAIMSKVDLLDHRPARSPLSPESWPLSPEKAAERRRHRRRRRTQRSLETLLDGDPSCTPYDRVPLTAEEPPATKPIEAPQPPPWSGSKIMGGASRCSIGVPGGVAITVAERKIAGSNAWGSEIMMNSEADRGNADDKDNDDDDDVNNCSSNRRSESDGFTSYDASSLPSLAIESSPWTVSHVDEDEDEERCDGPRWATKTAAGVLETPVTELIPLEAETHHRKQGGHAQNGGKPSTPSRATTSAKVSLTAASLGKEHDMQDGCLADHNSHPQPELYDVWIPQQYFQGKALTPSKRWRDTEPGESMLAVKLSEVVCVGSKPRRSGPGQCKASPLAGSIPTAPPSMKRCQEEMFVVEDTVGRGSSPSFQQPSPAIVTGNLPGEQTVVVSRGRRVSSTVSCVKNGGVSELEAANGDGHGSKSTTLIVDNPLLHPDGIMGARSEEEERKEEQEGSIDRWQEEDEDDEYFDYAKTFSWRAAAEVAAEGAAAQMGERLQIVRQGCGNEEFLAAGTERARIRSEQATRLAVGRLRAPQSVFNPLHRTPSRPEMRRSITHGRFSPVGRKLWRRSEGLSPRASQLCLRAVPPPGRILQSPASLDVRWGSEVGLSTPGGSFAREESQFGGSSVGPEGSGGLAEEAIKMEKAMGPIDGAAEAVQQDEARNNMEQGAAGDIEALHAAAIVRVPQAGQTAEPSNGKKTPTTIAGKYRITGRSRIVVDKEEHGGSIHRDLNDAAEAESATVRSCDRNTSGTTGQQTPTTTKHPPHGAPVAASIRYSVTIPSCTGGTLDPWSP